MAKKRPSLENYLKTGKVVWEEEVLDTNAEDNNSELTEKKADSCEASEPSKEKKPSPRSQKSSEEEKGNLSRIPEKREVLSEEEMLLIGMLAEEERTSWKLLLGQRQSSFMPLNVMEQRKAFREGKHKKGALYKLRRRGHVLEEIQEERQVAFPLLALIEETENLISVWCSQLK